MANGEKCNNTNCKTIVTEIRKKDGQYKKYCSPSCQRFSVTEKIKSTCLEKYGVSNSSKSQEIKSRIKESFEEKYGEGITNAMHLQEFKDKIKETNIEKYGTDKPQLLEEFENKSKQTCLEKFGIEKPQRLDSVKEKTKDTNIEKYGIEHHSKLKVTQDKKVKTNLEKYGVTNVSQNTEIYDKIVKRLYRTKDYILPSGKISKVQGYEPFAINFLLKNYSETEIGIDTCDKPRIQYHDDIGKQHYYFPDIYIPAENLIIEVKSEWTYNKNIPRHLLKRQACLNSGYNFKFMIFDKDGNLLEDK